ncbi:nitroreductase family protein [Ornithinibacillus sp. 4-3]|uniref:Nitroreductase family protein n=1 Tax=Ornithinibacillus sp. 4-3 TaxID=3231488 RepID=A0AB39HKB3_9BACI
MTETNNQRKANYKINPIYIERWSPRAYLNKEISDETLNCLFEAARWAPSAANVQPWRFIIARSDTDRAKFLTFINDGNKKWCDKAPVLVAVTSLKNWKVDSDDINPTHGFDTGAAWGFLSLEAIRQGLHTHAMGGFNREKAKEVLEIPDNYDVHAIIAIGYKGEKEMLDESLQQREIPSNRKPIEEFVFEGVFRK